MKIRWLTPGFWLADWQIKVASIVVAAGLWAYVRQDQTMILTLSVPLELRSPPQTMRLVRRPPAVVDVKFQVQRASVASLTPKSVRLVIDLARARGRRISIPLREADVIRPEGAMVLDITPSQLVLEFEPVGRDEGE